MLGGFWNDSQQALPSGIWALGNRLPCSVDWTKWYVSNEQNIVKWWDIASEICLPKTVTSVLLASFLLLAVSLSLLTLMKPAVLLWTVLWRGSHSKERRVALGQQLWETKDFTQQPARNWTYQQPCVWDWNGPFPVKVWDLWKSHLSLPLDPQNLWDNKWPCFKTLCLRA